MLVVMRTCSKCKGEFPATTEYFYTDERPNQRKDGLHSWCKGCLNESNHAAHRRRMAGDPQGFRDSKTDYRNNHIEQYRGASKRYRDKLKNNEPRRYHEMWVLSKYGLTAQDYEQMLNEQNNRCAICGDEKTSSRFLGKNFCVDHDHATNKVRGLLCHNCNAGLGYLGDSPVKLEKAMQYLKGGE